MIGNRKLIIDAFCEVYDLIKHWADAEFWDFSTHEIIPNAIYLIGREQMNLNRDRIVELVNNNIIQVIFSNPAEGSETIINHCTFGIKIIDLIAQGKIALITGGDVPDMYPHLMYENFLPKLYDYDENLLASQQYWNQYTKDRPYKFLFLNGRTRHHRRMLLDELAPILPTAIWSNLDPGNGPVKLLDAQYEHNFVDLACDTSGSDFVKFKLFENIWGEIYLHAAPYQDTYFSVVTETVHRYPYSFRTEKIWKPIAIGHPFIAVANQGFYRDLQKLGFQTFGHVIDESFDQIDNNDDRIKRVARVIRDLCQQDLASFLDECYNTCKYNQQHLAEMSQTVRKEFPQRFEKFINERFGI